MIQLSTLLLLITITSLAHSQIVMIKYESEVELSLTEEYQDTIWDLTKVVPLPGGIKLPDFYFKHMDSISDSDYCEPQNRMLNGLEDLAQNALGQLNVGELISTADPQLSQALQTGNSDGLNAHQKTIYDQLANFANSQNISLPDLIQQYQSDSSTSKVVKKLIEDGKEYIPAITKEIANKIDQLKEILNSKDLEQFIKQVKDAMKVDSANKNSVKIPLSKFMDGYTYYFSAKTSLNDQNKILEFVYIHSTKTMDIEELPTISEYVQISSRCVEYFKEFTLHYDFTASGLDNAEIDEVLLEFEPFFLFANEDPCVESLGWSVKKIQKKGENVNLLVQDFKFKVPFTPQEKIASFIQFTFQMKNGKKKVGFYYLTVKGYVIQGGGDWLKSIDKTSQLAVLGVVASTNQNQGTDIDIDKLEMSDLLALAKEASTLINLDSIASKNPIFAVLNQLLKKCSNSFTWMIQKLENQDFALDSVPTCGKEKLICGTNGKCQNVDGKELCVCNPNYAGKTCQYLESEYNALMKATSQIMGKIDNQIANDANYGEMMENIASISSQNEIDFTSANTIMKMIEKCIDKASNQKDLQKLLFAIEQLKINYKQMNLDLKSLSEAFGTLFNMFDKIIKKYVKILLAQNMKKLDFYSENQSGSIFQLLSQYDMSTDSLTIKLSKAIYDEKTKKYLPLPQITIKGISKLNMEGISSIVFSMKVEENGISIQVQLADENGENIQPQEKINYQFSLPIEEAVGVEQKCGYIDEESQQASTEGCQTLGNNKQELQCECDMPRSYIAIKTEDGNIEGSEETQDAEQEATEEIDDKDEEGVDSSAEDSGTTPNSLGVMIGLVSYGLMILSQ